MRVSFWASSNEGGSSSKGGGEDAGDERDFDDVLSQDLFGRSLDEAWSENGPDVDGSRCVSKRFSLSEGGVGS